MLDTLIWLASAPFAMAAQISKSPESINRYYDFVKYRRRLRGEPEWQEKDWEYLRIPPPQ